MIKPSILNARKPLLLLAMSGLLLALSGCGKDSEDGDIVNTIPLPTDDTIPFELYCPNVGLFNETCVLDDPNNPYARSPISEEEKFALSADAPSQTARFYVWATALAKGIGAPGENQFFAAQALHRMWEASGSELSRTQALRAYQSYADNYRNSVTFFEIPLDSDEFFPFSLDQFAGEMLFDPTNAANLSGTAARLFADTDGANRVLANQLVGEWGYFYQQGADPVTGTVTGVFIPF